MELSTATQLISEGITDSDNSQVWADAGAGKGLFTLALSDVLPPGSTIIAVDQDAQNLSQIFVREKAVLRSVNADMTTWDFQPESFDGIVLANSLHFVKNQVAFLKKLRQSLKTKGVVIIVEYNRISPNPWVPFPIPLDKLCTLSLESGFGSCTPLHQVPSDYHAGGIYSALLCINPPHSA